jgi:hypothetical protein
VIWLVIWSNDSNATVYYLQVPSGARLRWSHVPYAANWPDPVVMEANGNDTFAYCMYAEGTPPKPITIGTTTDGTQADWITGATPADAYINGNPYTVPADATLTTIKAKIGSVAGEFKCAIYSDLNGLADRLLATSQPKSNTTTGWSEFPLITPLKVKAGEVIWLVIWSNDSNATVYYLQVPSGARLRWVLAPYGPNWPDPIVMDPNGNDTFAYCLYAEGTLD